MSHPIHPLASSQSAVFLLNSRLGLLAAASFRSGSKSHHGRRHPFSRSYGVILPSSFTRFLSRALGFSPHLPVSVCGTDSPSSTLRSFSRQHGIGRSASSEDSTSGNASGLCLPDLPGRRPARFDRLFRQTAGLADCVPPSLRRGSTGILTCRPSTTPFGLALGSD